MKKPFQSVDISKHIQFNGTYHTYTCYLKSHEKKSELVFHHDLRHDYVDKYDLQSHKYERYCIQELTRYIGKDIYDNSKQVFNSFTKDDFIQGISFLKRLELHWNSYLTINEYYGINAFETIQFYINEIAIRKQTDRTNNMKLYLDIELDSMYQITGLAEAFGVIKTLENEYSFVFEDYRVKESLNAGIVIRGIFVQ